MTTIKSKIYWMCSRTKDQFVRLERWPKTYERMGSKGGGDDDVSF